MTLYVNILMEKVDSLFLLSNSDNRAFLFEVKTNLTPHLLLSCMLDLWNPLYLTVTSFLRLQLIHHRMLRRKDRVDLFG